MPERKGKKKKKKRRQQKTGYYVRDCLVNSVDFFLLDYLILIIRAKASKRVNQQKKGNEK